MDTNTGQLEFPEIVRSVRNADDIYTGGSQSNISLYHLVQDYIAGFLLLPAHQRESSWPNRKQKEYIRAICLDAAPPGSLEMYSLVTAGREGPKHLNDGVQRLFASLELYRNPSLFGLTPADADYILRNTEYPVRFKRHRSHQEALDRFQRVNSNVPLTPYQLTRGTILYCQGDDMALEWQKWLNDLNDIVSRALVRITMRHTEFNKSKSRYLILLHKSYRQTTSMFFRFLSKDQAGMEYSVSASQLKNETEFFELELAGRLREFGISGARELLEKFRNIIDNESGLIADAWLKCKHNKPGLAIKSATVRWLLDCSIYRRNCGIPVDPWSRFIDLLLNENGGATEVFYRDRDTGRIRRYSLSLGRVRQMWKVADVIASDLSEWEERTRVKLASNLQTGYHHSHIKPYAKYGNGKIVPEPALKNLARGASEVDVPFDGS